MPTIVEVPVPPAPTPMRRMLVTGFIDLVVVTVVVAAHAWVLLVPLILLNLPLLLGGRLAEAARKQQVARLEVTDTEITSVHGNGVRRSLVRSGGDVVRVRTVGRGLQVQVVGADTEQSLFPARGLDPDRLRAAVHAHGWSFQNGPHAPVEAPPEGARAGLPPEPPAAAGTTLVLREGVPKLGARSPLSWLLVALAAVPAALAVIRWETDPWLTPWVVAPWLAAVFGLWVTAAVVVQSRSVEIGPERITYRSGAYVHTAARADTIALTVGPRWIKPRGPLGPTRVWLPVKWRREELLALLRANGWPLEGG